MKKKKRHDNGFTLIEVLAALTILGILIPPIMGLFVAASANIHRSTMNTVAFTVARDIMDRIKAGDINAENKDKKLNSYREQHGVSIYVSGITEKSDLTLSLVKVYVAPREDMDPQREGIMLSSYTTNVYIDRIDTASPPITGSGENVHNSEKDSVDGYDAYN